MTARLLYVPFDQLNCDYGVLKSADPQSDAIVMIESDSMIRARNWHPERLYFLISAARHFAQSMRDRGFTVMYLNASSIEGGLKQARAKLGETDVLATEPSSIAQRQSLEKLGVSLAPNDFFLTSRELFNSWAIDQKSFRMENFYRKQRVRLDILMDGNQPLGGAWNFDADNRLPPPRNYEWPPYLIHEPDDLDRQVAAELDLQPSGVWATTREGAVVQLTYFLTNNFAGFGPYEDAVPADNWAAHHSLLSTYLNVGLLHPSEVVDAAINRFNQGGVPIESCEAFIRQIIGWREYVNGMYWYLGEEYSTRNALSAERKLLPVFNDSTTTSMACVSATIADIDQRSWVHHIPRLMILSNLALIAGVNPQEFLHWMRERFIDAADWVMVPNVIGMGLHADGGLMMTKPYAAGGAYISRMTRYCKECEFDPKKRTGDNACPFTTLYWDFLDRNRAAFARNHRMGQQIRGLDRLSDLDQIRERAKEVLSRLERGSM